ncbi:MAG TPA: hypothetical protein VK939_11710 [Longimicrobiales bacterium]|nr:hypothetical protein [Longimicrobiales bacterium]
MRESIRALLLVTVLAGGCAIEPAGSGTAADPAPAAPWGSPVSDSVRPVAVELAAFREGMTAPRRLEGGARSREALVRALVGAVERRDTTRLRELHLSAAEFAWFYYPYTIHTHPPYQQAPGMVWLLTTQNSQKGMTRALRRLGGQPLGYRGHDCVRSEPQDLNTLHAGCGVRLAGDSVPRRLFGTIIERAGRFKFVSYANSL